MTTRFRLAPVNPVEHDRQTDIVNYLRHEPRVAVVIRINSGSVKTSNRFIRFYRVFVRGLDPMDGKGCSDILAQLRGGWLAALEVKRPGEPLTDKQAGFLAAVAAGGGLAARVETWQQARGAISDFLALKADEID